MKINFWLFTNFSVHRFRSQSFDNYHARSFSNFGAIQTIYF